MRSPSRAINAGLSPSVASAARGTLLPVAFEFRRFRLQSNPTIARLTTKYLLPLGTRQVGDNVVFFNFGYEEDPPMDLPLKESDEESDRYCIQLYHVTASQVDLAGKRVLEVSCGAGGGASYIMRTLGPASYTGMDLNPASIELCRREHRSSPDSNSCRVTPRTCLFPDEAFDAVINVEASHQYPDFIGFLAEVARVLRPGGHFLYTDNRRPGAAGWWDTVLSDAPLRADFEAGHPGRGEAGAGGQHATVRRAAKSPLAVVRWSASSVTWSGVLDWDLRRDSGISYRLYGVRERLIPASCPGSRELGDGRVGQDLETFPPLWPE